MAKVPNAGFPQIGAKAEATPYSRVQATSAAFGALQGQAQEQLGKAIEGVSQQGMEILTQINKENTQRMAKYADNTYSNLQRTELYGDGTDANPGLMNLQGQAALDARAGVVQRLADARVKISSSLDNRVAKDMFDASANERDDVALKNTMSHVAQQRTLANETASHMRAQSAVDNGTLGSADPATVHLNEIVVQQEAISRAMAKGLPQDAVLDYAKQEVSKYYESVITDRMQTNTQAGKDMMTTYSDRIQGAQASLLTKRIEAKEKDDVNQAWAKEEHAHTKRIQYQQDNFSGMVSDIQFKGKGLVDIQVALDSGRINGEQAENLVNQYQVKAKGGPGDPRRANDLKYQVMTNQASYKEVMNDPNINETQRSSLLTVTNAVANNGGVLANQSVQDGQKTIDVLVANKTSLLKDIDDVAAARLTVATEAFHTRVMVPGTDLSPVNVDRIAREVASAYVAPTLADPKMMIDNVLPRTKYWSSSGPSDKKSLSINLQQSALKLLMDRKHLSPTEFAAQGRILRMYSDAINGMSDKPIVLNPTTK